jgi:hypothetical protein
MSGNAGGGGSGALRKKENFLSQALKRPMTNVLTGGNSEIGPENGVPAGRRERFIWQYPEQKHQKQGPAAGSLLI